MTEILFEHGGDLEGAARLVGCSPRHITDFSNLLNPAGFPPGLEEALKSQLKDSLLHPSSGDALKNQLARVWNLRLDQVFLGCGTTEFIHFLPLFRKPRKAVIVGPSYGDYAPALRRIGLEPQWLMATEEKDWVIPSKDWESCLKEGIDFVFLSRPNNPLGQSLYRPLVKDLIQSHPGTFFVVDETCIELAEDPADHCLFDPWPRNLAVLRSFSKTYAVPGLRLGVLLMHPDHSASWRAFQMPWTVTPLAQAAGLYLVHQENWASQARVVNRLEKKRIDERFKDLKGFSAIPSGMTAYTIKGISPGFSAARLLQDLLRDHQILIRDLSQHPGLGASYFRIGLRTPPENDRLMEVLAAWQKE